MTANEQSRLNRLRVEEEFDRRVKEVDDEEADYNEVLILLKNLTYVCQVAQCIQIYFYHLLSTNNYQCSDAQCLLRLHEYSLWYRSRRPKCVIVVTDQKVNMKER